MVGGAVAGLVANRYILTQLNALNVNGDVWR